MILPTKVLGKLIGTLSTFFQIGGVKGPGLASSGSSLQARDATNTVFTNLAGADPTVDDDFVTKRYGDANYATADDAIVVPFTYETPSPLVLQAVTSGQSITRAVIIVTVPFTDGAATVEWGTSTDPTLLFAAGDVQLAVANQYDSEVIADFTITDILQFVIDPGSSTAGSGTLYYWIQ